jgi:hypothetical protein
MRNFTAESGIMAKPVFFLVIFGDRVMIDVMKVALFCEFDKCRIKFRSAFHLVQYHHIK